jgi:hypothetical protein
MHLHAVSSVVVNSMAANAALWSHDLNVSVQLHVAGIIPNNILDIFILCVQN